MSSRSPARDDRGGYPSRSRSRSASRSPRSDYSRSRSPAPRRRGRSPTRSPSRSPARRNGRRYDSRSASRSQSRSRSRSRSASPKLHSTKLVVEKLTKNIEEQHLREMFGEYGEIEDLDLPIGRNGFNRGSAYILYYEEADAEAAIAHMHEATIDGSIINVSIVLPRSKFSQNPPGAVRNANIDPRVPPPNRGGGGRSGRHGRGPRGGPRAENTYRPGPEARARSRSPVGGNRSVRATEDVRGGYRDRSPFSDRSHGDGRRSRNRSEDRYSRSRSRSYR